MQAVHASSVRVVDALCFRPHTVGAKQSRSPQLKPTRSARPFTARTHPVARTQRFGRPHTCIKAAAADLESQEHLQLATAKLPKNIDTPGFVDSMYQWAATLTTSGQNMPFALPIQADKLEKGFQMSLLRIKDGQPISVGDIKANVEPVENQGDVLFVRFFEGAGSGIDRQGPPIKDSRERLQKNAEALIDIPIIMRTMKVAIQKAVAQNKS